jgi:hypothetical protein
LQTQANPVGLAYDLRAGTPVLGPELVVNGDFSAGMAGWALAGYTTAGTPSGGSVRLSGIAPGTNFNELAYQTLTTVVGRTYKIAFPSTLVAGNVSIACYASGISGGFIDSPPSSGDIYIQATSTTTTLTVFAWNGASTDVPFDVTVGPATVKEVPGNHMLQSTSAARPLMSARVNLLTKTEDFSDAVWVPVSVAPTVNTSVAPDGTMTADTLSEGTNNSRHTLYVDNFQVISGAVMTFSLYVKYVDRRYFVLGFDAVGIARVFFDLVDGVVTSEVSSVGAIESVGGGWYRVSITITTTGVGSYPQFSMSDRDSATAPLEFGTPTYTGENKTVLIWGAQLNYGPTALPYQRVNTASDYNASGFPIAQLYDGVDDGMATAAFTAGTLIDGMDCMIAVRRDSAAATYLISDTASRGFFEWESGDTDRPDVSAGTPTYYVDGVACTATRGALFTALTAGDWHILEARGLDLSTWLKVEVSSLVSYRLNGARGDILLFPSTDSTEDKDAARQYLADYYGVTLP